MKVILISVISAATTYCILSLLNYNSTCDLKFKDIVVNDFYSECTGIVTYKKGNIIGVDFICNDDTIKQEVLCKDLKLIGINKSKKGIEL